MKNDDLMDAQTACGMLGVKPQTLYAYVSRYKIRTKTDPRDCRQSLYVRHDIEGLLHNIRRPRARADVAQAAIRWGDPVLKTAISEVRDGTIWLRERAIQECASNMTLEQTTALLCDVSEVVCPQTKPSIGGATPFARAIIVLAAEVEKTSPMRGQDVIEIGQDVGRMIALVTEACLGCGQSGPIHLRVGKAWKADSEAQDAIRRSLVLLSDHELNPSTFAVRVCASTGASLPAALLAGMTTLSGPGHGGVANLARAALSAANEGKIAEFLDENLRHTPYAFGFSHPLYPAGDPRAVDLLKNIPKNAPARKAVDALSEFLSLPPNIDAALAAASAHYEWPNDAAAILFSIGRTAGWVAHAIEQVQSGEMIRPRSKYKPGLERNLG